MEHIDCLLKRARKITSGGGWHIFGVTEYRPELGKYTLSGSVWYGMDSPGGNRFYSEHDTEAQACTAIAELGDQYPGADTLNFVMGYGVTPCRE